MRIISLKAENFKRLRVVELTPDPNQTLIEVRGRNGQGKSSVLDAIWAALGGADNIPTRPVRNGEDQATITLDLGTVTVTRRFRTDNTTNPPNTTSSLRVTAADGARYQSPQRMIDDLIGAVAFDPLDFTRQKPKDQLERLRALIKPPLDFTKIDAQNATDYAERTAVNRDLQALKIHLEGLPEDPTLTPQDLAAGPADTQALTNRLAQASAHNTDIATRQAGRERAAEQITTKRLAADNEEKQIETVIARIEETFCKIYAEVARDISDLEKRLVLVNERRSALITERADREKRERIDAAKLAADFRTAADVLQAKLDAAPALPAQIDATTLAQEIEQATQLNARLERARRRTDAQTQLTEAEAAAAHLTAAITARNEDKRAALAAATYPVPGLSLGQDEVLFNDVPLSQASQAEQIRVGVAVAVAANPNLHVLTVRDGSLLDHQSLALLADLVKEHDYQLWLEVTDDAAQTGVIIEDGSVVNPDQQHHPEHDKSNVDATPIGFTQELPI